MRTNLMTLALLANLGTQAFIAKAGSDSFEGEYDGCDFGITNVLV